MRAVVIGARGAVGTGIVNELVRRGHEVTKTSRSAADGFVPLNLDAPTAMAALTTLAADHDVVINASGIEHLGLATMRVPVVEISATSSYLHGLAEQGADAVVLGAGLAPGLSTVLIAALDRTPTDNIDLGVMLGVGERHGDAAVEWTAGLVGRDVYSAPDGAAVRNFVTSRVLPGSGGGRRRYLRADFPDHVLLAERGAAERGVVEPAPVRSYLTLTSRSATWALGIAGRQTWLAPLIARTPHVGSDRWVVVACNRRTGDVVGIEGRGQSSATAVMTVLAAESAFARAAAGPIGAVTMADLVTVAEVVDRLRHTDDCAREFSVTL